MNIFPPTEQSLSPFQFYADMRHNNPVAYDDRNNIWGVFRYYDVQFILGDYMHFSSAVPPTKLNDLSKEVNEEDEDQKMPFSRPSLLKSDPPYHRTLRAVVASAFTPMTISKLEPRIESITHDLLNQIIEKGNMDLINDLAYPLPVTVIAELLGVPLQDRDTFRTWADKLISSAGSQLNAEHHGSAKNLISIQSEMDDYFNAIIDKRTITPQTDLISNLIKAEADGHHLSREEILAFCTLLLLAGHVTTVNLIGNTILSLLQNPQEFKKLKEDRTSSSLIPSIIEETLRYRSPVQAVFHMTTQDITIGGAQKIPSGQGIVVWLGSANHDESVFPDPEKFDISRIPHAHSHVGFGHGIHFCLGAPLARLEAGVALKIILERLQNLELDDSNIEHIKPLHSLFFHGVSQLPLRFTHGNLVKADEDQHDRI
ncbi:MAG TPA: cytochrome P450 [Nitrososphaeraceae archaeon]|nr:cytochrome P450 [Nitrososphaeraceae archaeon]